MQEQLSAYLDGELSEAEARSVAQALEAQPELAAELQRLVIPINAAVTTRFGIAGLKVALDMLGFYGGPVRSPLMDLDDDQRQILRAVLVEGGVFP